MLKIVDEDRRQQVGQEGIAVAQQLVDALLVQERQFPAPGVAGDRPDERSGKRTVALGLLQQQAAHGVEVGERTAIGQLARGIDRFQAAVGCLLQIAERIELLPSGSPVAAIGAAMVGAGLPAKEIMSHG